MKQENISPIGPIRPIFFFDPEERQQKLRQILDSWLGTPYRHWCGVKGRGADCIQFVGRALEEAGAVTNPVFPEYPPDWHLHRCEERLLQGILGQARIMECDVDDPHNGDIILFRFGRASAHSALYMDRHIYQSIVGIGVMRIQWQDPMWHERRSHCLRIYEQ